MNTNLEFSKKKLFKTNEDYNISHQNLKLAHFDAQKKDDFKNSTAVILAGGKARRFENKNKALLKLNGERFIDIILNQLCLFNKVYISAANNHQYDKEKYNIILDKFEDKGPVGAIVSSLETVGEDYVFFIPCDMPLINNNIVNSFVYALKKSNADAIISCDTNGKIHPLCCAINKKALPTLKNELLNNNLRLLKIFQKLDTYIINVDDEFLININTQNDLTLLENLINKK